MQIAKGSIGEVIIFRLSPGEDVLFSMERACEQFGISNGVVLSGIGSLNGARFFDPMALPDKKAGYGYSDVISLEGPIEITGMSGMICEGENKEVSLHVHYSLSDEKGTAYGGHLIEGNIVLLTVEVAIAQIKGVSMGRAYDPDIEVFVMNPKSIL